MKRRHACLAGATLTALIGAATPFRAGAALTPDERERVEAAERQRVETVARVYGAVVAVLAPDKSHNGSGVIFHRSGFALTNFHVVNPTPGGGKAGLADGKTYDWRTIGIDPGGDLALIRLKGDHPFPVSPLGDSTLVRVGDPMMAMGNPFGLAEDYSPTVTRGIVSGVERFQRGMKGLLVYGNCIQVDTSINPGNSGGPLFNARGEVVGINGRVSFEERVRVNVGVGYAISMEQARRFIPDLLATKVCEHATLNATFADEKGRVVCTAVAKDSPIAKAGLRQGDTLIALDGRAIRSANDYLNRITTYPAHWPVTVEFARGEARERAVVRLSVLPYKVAEEPAGKPGKGVPKVAAKGKKPTKPGEIADAKVNREGAEWILSEWTANRTGGAKPAGGRKTMSLTARRTDTGPATQRSWTVRGDGHVEAAPPSAAVVEAPLPLGPMEGILLLNAEPWKALKELSIEGGDRAGDRAAYRLRLVSAKHGAWWAWFSVFGQDEQPGVELIKLARADGDRDAGPAALYSGYRRVEGLLVPGRRAVVKGLEESPGWVDELADVRVSDDTSPAPAAAAKSEAKSDAKPPAQEKPAPDGKPAADGKTPASAAPAAEFVPATPRPAKADVPAPAGVADRPQGNT